MTRTLSTTQSHGPALVAGALLLVVIATGTPPVAAQPIDSTAVFFSFHLQEYARMENLELLPEGKVMMPPHGVTDLSEFTWERMPHASLSWWLDIEEMLYLIPFIASDEDDDRRFAVNWYRSWRGAHAGRQTPNEAAWDGMTTGMRAGVLVYFFKRERARDDGGISPELLGTLQEHRDALVNGRFDDNSNHGVWQAIGMIEVGRALADSATLELGLTRLEGMARAQVSPAGFHLEHSPHYHFVFLKWLDEAVSYLRTLPELRGKHLQFLSMVHERMMKAGYFLQDHQGTMLPIGDTFRRPVFPVAAVDDDGELPTTAFDIRAGYACYKEPEGDRSGRQVVFNIQRSMGKFRFHFHDDALAAVVSYRGESLIGDQGGYDYSLSYTRQFIKSRAAHSLVGPAGQTFLPGTYAVRPALKKLGADSVLFSAERKYGRHSVERTVLIPGGSPVIHIEDTFAGPEMMMAWNIGVDVMWFEEVFADTSGGVLDRRWRLTTIAGRTFEMKVTCDKGRTCTAVVVYEGSKDPMMGWYSPAFQSLVESKTLALTFLSPDPVTVKTTFTLLEDDE